MKFTRDWLYDHLDTARPLEEILEALPMLGLEVESFDDPAQRLAFARARRTLDQAAPRHQFTQIQFEWTGR